jgi:hypothetical protein
MFPDNLLEFPEELQNDILCKLNLLQTHNFTILGLGQRCRGEPNFVCASRDGQENECQDLTDQEDEWYCLVNFLVCNSSVARKLTKLE